MKQKFLAITLLSVIIVSSVSIAFASPLDVNVPPTRAFAKIFSGTSQVTAKNYLGQINVTAGSNISILLSNGTTAPSMIISASGTGGGLTKIQGGNLSNTGVGIMGPNFNASMLQTRNLASGNSNCSWSVNATHNTITCSTGTGAIFDSIVCSPNNFINAYNNVTHLANCALPTATGVTSLNFTTSSDFDFNLLPRNMSMISLDGTVFNFKLKSNIVLTNESAQTITKALTLNSAILGGDMNVGSNALTNSGHKSTLPLTTGQILQANGSAASLTNNVRGITAGTGISINGSTGTVQVSATSSGGPTVLAANVTSSSTTAFTHVWNIPLTANSGNAISGILVASSNTAGGAVQVGANMSSISTGSGSCTFHYGSTATAEVFFTSLLGLTSSDSAWTVWLSGANQAAPITFTCAVQTGSSAPTLQINFQAEVASTVAIKAGSYYVKTP